MPEKTEIVPAGRVGRFFARVDQAGGGYPVDLVLYGLSTVFALITALSSTLMPHRAWGSVAVWAYAIAFVLSAVQFAGYRIAGARPIASVVFGTAGRAALTWLTWAGAALLPLVMLAVERAGGRTDRAQEEVLVVERMGERLVNDGTPYLSRDAIAALPADERLLGYSPYQPGMSIFGLPRAIAGDAWWTDARVWFALVTALALITAVLLLRPRRAAEPHPDDSPATERWRSFAIVRATQAVTVLPICALTLATGGDDIPVLAFCVLAFALAATNRYGWAGVAVGAAAACKLFAFPVVAVLLVLALATARGGKLLPGALGLPLLVLVPPFQVDQDAFVENVIRFPTGHGLVTSPAQSPFPGYLIAQNVPDGRLIALGLLIAVAVAITVRMIWWSPRSAASAASICGWGLLAAILLMPTTRFGYLLYPAAFLVWAAALRPAHRNHTATSSPLDDTALYRL
ncbi:glycosyltransferase 87 family protein [Actinoplanes sp. URMC 104]|uniref:glycosyltransferase 87 family protein n=1 Tax=Actinoplanes sp. URMC 104 TaxID=3423409 RepID=UPI003F1A0B71